MNTHEYLFYPSNDKKTKMTKNIFLKRIPIRAQLGQRWKRVTYLEIRNFE